MKRLVLVRHGQSMWNLENRFTGWTDVDLTDRGVEEATDAAKLLKEAGFVFDQVYDSKHHLSSILYQLFFRQGDHYGLDGRRTSL